MGNVFFFIKKKFPAGVLIDAGLESYDLYVIAMPVWKAVSKMEKYGGKVIDKFLGVIKSTGGNVLDKLKYVDDATGINLSDIGSPDGFFDDFQNAIAEVFDDLEILGLEDLAPYELAGFKFNNNVIRVSIKTGGNTTDGYTLQIKWGNQGNPLKFRFI